MNQIKERFAGVQDESKLQHTLTLYTLNRIVFLSKEVDILIQKEQDAANEVKLKKTELKELMDKYNISE